jgi:curli biogenesis system outer membrane secretion channel CsgG
MDYIAIDFAVVDAITNEIVESNFECKHHAELWIEVYGKNYPHAELYVESL